MATIIVIDDEAVIREPMAASIRARGHRVTCAGSACEALTILQSTVPDLILLDVRMPQEDGISLLHKLRACAATASLPVLLLSNVTDKTTILHAAKLGTQGYVLKSAFSLDDLLSRINAICERKVPDPAESLTIPPISATQSKKKTSNTSGLPNGIRSRTVPRIDASDKSTWPRLLTAEQTLARVSKVGGGKPIAGVLSQLISVANSPNSDLSDVVAIIQSDPVLAARVLLLANGSASGSHARIRDVEDAARNLGIRAIQNMAMSVGIVSEFAPDGKDKFDIMRCWQHSYAVAVLLNILMRSRNPEFEGIYHLIGLCHEMGTILLRQDFASEYEQIIAFSHANALPIHSVQSVALGLRPSELVGRLLVQLGLPTQVVKAIREFVEWQIRPESITNLNSISQALALANSAAHGLLLAADMRETIHPITRTEWGMVIARDLPAPIAPIVLRNDIVLKTTILARLSAKEEQRLLATPIPRSAIRIWYVRPQYFSEFDPLAFALMLCCDLQISSELPTGDIWHSIDGLIVVGIRAGVKPIISEELLRASGDAGKASIPILGLVSEDPLIQDNADCSLQLRRYPISLEYLSQWLLKIFAMSDKA